MMTNRAGDHDEEDPRQRRRGRQPQQGGTPPGGKICKEGLGKGEGLASAKEVHRAVIQVDDGDTAFLLMLEATVVTATASSSTIASGASSWLGVGTMTIIPGLSSPGQRPVQ
jgi:hypothetical protein